jgi:serine/threonine protein kinase
MQASGVGCLTEEEILSLLGGRLAGRAHADARAHVDACTACQDVLAIALRTVGTGATNAGGATDDDAADVRTGEVVGRYRIDKRLGIGAMGVVYLAQDLDLHRNVALKILRRQTADTAVRLQREARALARVSHPNVIVVHEVGTFDGRVFMAMEFVDGSSLASWLRAAPRSTAEIIEVFLQAGRGLAVAHEAGLVHRDFKPDNVLVGNDGRVRVVDFGLARKEGDVPLPAQSAMLPGLHRSLTRTGAVIGTPAYMAPEQLAGAGADARSDQFAFSVALFEALWDARPFASERIDVVTGNVTRGGVRVPSGRRVPNRLSRAIRRGLSEVSAERFPSMVAMLEELARGARSPRGRASTLLAVGFASVAVLLFAYGAYARRSLLHAENAALGVATSASAPSSAIADVAPAVPSTDGTGAVGTLPSASATGLPSALSARSSRATPRGAPSSKRAICNPPYYVDSNGIEHVKEGCF